MDKELAKKVNKLLYGLMKGARRDGFFDFLEYWGLTEDDFEKISAYFETLGLEL